MLAVDWKWGGRDNSGYFFPLIWFGQQFQHWLSPPWFQLLLDVLALGFCGLHLLWLFSSGSVTSFLCCPSLCCFTILWLAFQPFQYFYSCFAVLIFFHLTTMYEMCFPDWFHFHLLLDAKSCSWIWPNEDMIMIAQNKCFPYDPVLILTLWFSPWFSLKFSLYPPHVFTTFLGFPHYLRLLLLICLSLAFLLLFLLLLPYCILSYSGINICLYHI